jgi:uncharacterized protein YecE (DUF72 family)
MGIYIGVGGWTYEPWHKTFHPKGLPQKRELEYASSHLTAIEINGTCYGSQERESFGKRLAGMGFLRALPRLPQGVESPSARLSRGC